jgi:hypothetical protein
MSEDVLVASVGKADTATPRFGGVEVDAPPTSSKRTVYDALREEFNRPAEAEQIVLAVPNRPAIKVIYDPNQADYDTMERIQRTARHGKKVDVLHLSSLVLQYTMVGLLFNNEPIVEDDEPLTVADRKIQDLLEVDNAKDAIKKLYGSDGHIMAATQAVMTAAGYNYDEDDLEETYPK